MMKLKNSSFYLILITVVLTLFLFIPQTWITWQDYKNFQSFVNYEFRLQYLTQRTTYIDEVLTMSARMYSMTGNAKWKERYNLYEPELDKVIQESIKISPELYLNKEAKLINDINEQLLEIETQSFDLVKQGKQAYAQILLFGYKYETLKKQYEIANNNRNSSITLQMQSHFKHYSNRLILAFLVSIGSFIVLIPLWLLVLKLLQEHLNARKIAQAILKETNEQLENRVKQRTQELNEKNFKLGHTLKKLQHTQAQLIQTEKMSSLGQMVAGIAHEINNPINFVYGNVSYTQEAVKQLLILIDLYQQFYPHPPELISKEIEEMDFDFFRQDFDNLSKSMQEGIRRVQEIVKSLRNFSRLDEAKIKTVNIHEGIDSTLMILQHRLQLTYKHPEISIIKEYNFASLIECYPAQINQVFFNIFNNAIDALEEKNSQSTLVEVLNKQNYIRICTEAISEDWLAIRVINNGCGIPKNIISKVFDYFFTTKPVGKGAGIGLSTSYEIIVNQHGGRLRCYSEPEQDTEFVIEIPITQPKR
jgi:signal transduction histidine kinase